MSNSSLERIIYLASNDTKKGARVVAKYFHKILRKNGYSESQIIDIATNMLNCLTESLKGYEQKAEKTVKKETPVKMYPGFHQRSKNYNACKHA